MNLHETENMSDKSTAEASKYAFRRHHMRFFSLPSLSALVTSLCIISNLPIGTRPKTPAVAVLNQGAPVSPTSAW